MIEIDGSYGEGGGAVVRTAVGMSAVTGKPVRVFNIRKNRPAPGLRAQHMHGLKAVADACGGVLKGADLHSTDIIFEPGSEWKKKIKVEIPTAGSVGLALQVLQIACLRAKNPVKVEFKGGASWGKWAPPLVALQKITYPTLEKMGYKITLDVEREGFYPVGGCRATAEINPCKNLKPIIAEERGEVVNVKGVSVAAEGLRKAQIAERQKKACRDLIFNKLGVSVEIEERYVASDCPGSGVLVWAKTSEGLLFGGDCIGERGLPAEKVGNRAAANLLEGLDGGAHVDKHLQDQILTFTLLSEGNSIDLGELTSHSKTNKWVCEKFM